jgi:hypothetical protein
MISDDDDDDDDDDDEHGVEEEEEINQIEESSLLPVSTVRGSRLAQREQPSG